MNSQFSLRWNNYVNQLTEAFGSLLHQEDLVDVTLSCEGKKIKAHKMLLSACSPYFCGVFKENPCQHPVVVFRNVQFADLKAIIDFIYCGEVNVAQEQLESFLSTAEMLEVKGLTDKENESEVVETSGLTNNRHNVQTDKVRAEQQINTLSRKQDVHTSGRSSRLAKKRKLGVEKPPESPAPIEVTADVKEEVEEIFIVDDQIEDDSSDPLSIETSRLESKPSIQGSDAELSATSQEIVEIVEESSDEEAVKENIAHVPKVEGKRRISQERRSPDFKPLELKTTSVPLKKRKQIKEEEISLLDEIPAKSKKKAPGGKCATDPAEKTATLETKVVVKSKPQIPRGLVITSVQAASEVEDSFDFPSQEPHDVQQDEASIARRSEDATTPVHEETYIQETQVYDDVPSGQIPDGEPGTAAEAPVVQEQTESEALAEEELKQPEFDYFGCEVCRNEAKPVDLDRLTFSKTCPICPYACFCGHILKAHMKAMHGWFNVHRRFTQY